MKQTSTQPPHLWLRSETKSGEHRTPLTPTGAQALLQDGFHVTVESMPSRVFSDEDYVQVGCNLVSAGSWRDASSQAWILGLKELPNERFPLEHRHIYFAHAYKGQDSAAEILTRFKDGNGTLLDLEYLIENKGRRVAAFGYWAGYIGAALSLLGWAHNVNRSRFQQIKAFESQSLLDDFVDEQLAKATRTAKRGPTGIVIGALGRSGGGACACLERHEIVPERWDLEQTAVGGPFPEILQHDILLNCVLLSTPTKPFIRMKDIAIESPLRVVCDVSCDPQHPFNPLPIYDHLTSFEQPLQVIEGSEVGIISIDNLPALLPKESSEDFASQLLPHLRTLPVGAAPWQACQTKYLESINALQ